VAPAWRSSDGGDGCCWLGRAEAAGVELGPSATVEDASGAEFSGRSEEETWSLGVCDAMCTLFAWSTGTVGDDEGGEGKREAPPVAERAATAGWAP
jgi:hypothetical protein